MTWALPPVFGLSFLVWVVEMFDLRQLGLMMLALPLPVYVSGAIIATDFYFRRFAAPIVDYLDYLEAPTPAREEAALARARRFPLDFWSLFVAYLALAPVAVMASAHLAYGFEPRPVDWFRIELVSLVVSIIVGLPIFFSVLDLFGRAFRDAHIRRAHTTVQVKVFLIGAAVPLLIDTMLVQYYWTSTGYFTSVTFLVWLVLELLAIAGAIMFVRSFRQSLEPLGRAVEMAASGLEGELSDLRPQSTDELGVVAHGYRRLLHEIGAHNRLLSLKNQLLRELGAGASTRHITETILEAARHAVGADDSMLALYDAATDSLVVAARSDGGYREEGYLRIPRGTPSLSWLGFESDGVEFTPDCLEDDRIDQDIARNSGLRSALVCPLIAQGERIGVVVAAFHAPQQRPEDSVERLFASIASEASAFLQNAFLRERQDALQRQLMKSQQLEGIGRLAGGVAHDFNNILTAILGCASLMVEDLGPGDGREEAQEIMDSAGRAAVLTRQLLALSRKQVLETKAMDLTVVIQDLYAMLRRLIPSRIVFDLDLSEGLWRVHADRTQIEQVIMNLVVNARDAIAGQGNIVIATRNLDGRGGHRAPEGQWVVVEVTDDGSGIDPDTRDRIFEPYFTTKEAGRGTGLGLATVAGIISQSGGHIFVDSEPGQKTRFTVLLPRTDAVALAPRPAATSTLAGRRARIVLVAEDDRHVRGLVVSILGRQSLTVLQAGRGDEALALAESHEGAIDVLVSDVVMPGIGGVELAERVKALRPNIRIMLMSGYADATTLDAIAASGLPFISKPFTAKDFAAQFGAMLDGHAEESG